MKLKIEGFLNVLTAYFFGLLVAGDEVAFDSQVFDFPKLSRERPLIFDQAGAKLDNGGDTIGVKGQKRFNLRTRGDKARIGINGVVVARHFEIEVSLDLEDLVEVFIAVKEHVID